MKQDAREKRARFIDSSAKTREMFAFAHPLEQIAAIDKYCCSIYGSNIYTFRDKEFGMICTAHKVGIKLAWGVNRACRTFLVQQVLAPDAISLRTSLLLRFCTFYRSLITSCSYEVQVMAHIASKDMRTTLGSNLELIWEETGLDPVNTPKIILKRTLHRVERVPIPPMEKWKISYLTRLLKERLWAFYNGDEQILGEIDKLLDSLVI